MKGLRHFLVDTTLGSGLLLGAISGLIGAGVWKTVLELHPDPPKIKEERYYAHLILAHLVFGAFATLGYRIKEPQQFKHEASYHE